MGKDPRVDDQHVDLTRGTFFVILGFYGRQIDVRQQRGLGKTPG